MCNLAIAHCGRLNALREHCLAGTALVDRNRQGPHAAKQNCH
jgi:hypothetical protein